jgi:hypothetical protein
VRRTKKKTLLMYGFVIIHIARTKSSIKVLETIKTGGVYPSKQIKIKEI